MNKIIRTIALSWLCLNMLTGCYNNLQNIEFGRIEWSPELAVPLLNSSITLVDIIKEADSTIKYQEENGIMVITFEDDSLYNSNSREFYSLKDQIFPTIPTTLTPNEVDAFNISGAVTITRQAVLLYDSNLDSVFIESGQMNIFLEEDYPANGNLSLSISAAGKQLITYDYSWNHDGFNAITSDSESKQFEDVKFITAGSNPENSLLVDYTLTLTKSDNTDLVLLENTMNLDIGIVNTAFEALYGDLIQQDISTENNVIQTNFFSDIDDLQDVNYFFQDPRFSITYKNSMGLPVEFNFNDFTYYKAGEEKTVIYKNEVRLAKGTASGPSISTVSFNEQFKTIINDQPDSIALEIDGIIDPENTTDNFVTKTSGLQIGYQLDLPLAFSLSGINVVESFAIDDIDPQNTRYALINLQSFNQLPFDVTLKAVALSEDSTELNTLFEGILLEGGSVEEPSTYEALIELIDDPNTESNELDFLKDTKSISIIASLATINGGTEIVKVSSLAALEFSLSLQAQYTISIDTSEN